LKRSCEEERNLKKALSVNGLAWSLLEDLLQNSVLYRVEVEKTRQGTIIVDAGTNTRDGFEAGRLITEICMGGLGRAKVTSRKYGDVELPSIFVCTDHPAVAALGSQFAGWHIKEGEYSAIGSGPARALALKPREMYREIAYKDQCDRAVLVLETEKSPPSKLIERLSRDCGIKPDKLALVLTPTTSIAGATQISGRTIETGMHKLKRLGLDPKTILCAWGSAPVSPVHPKFAKAMARTNDAILYGGTAYYVVESDNQDALQKIVEKAPSNASKSYGKPFVEIFKEASYDFYKIDADLFAPAVVVISDVKSGKTFKSGEINVKMLKRSFDMCGQ
jgi:methenyltetrahydromethanopterin cyclohydrolase